MAKMVRLSFLVDGKVFSTTMHKEGEAIVPIQAPEKTGHRFIAWKNLPDVMPRRDFQVEAEYEALSYRLRFVTEEGVHQEQALPFGAPIVPPADPEKRDHTFDGWSNLPATMPARNIEVRGTFTPLPYVLRMVVDEQEYATYEFPAGASLTELPLPAKIGHTFSGWNKNYKKMPRSNLTLKGSFKVNKYELRFVIEGEMDFARKVEYGAPIRPLGVPMRENHTFSGWGSIPATMPAHDLEFVGRFTLNAHELRFLLEDELIFSAVVDVGTPIKAPEVPMKTGYMFSGWRGLPKVMPDHPYEAAGRYYLRKYKVRYILDGEEYEEQTVAYGAPVVPAQEPVKEGYVFGGWKNLPPVMPAEDITVTGSWGVRNQEVKKAGGAING
ncbi:MAG: InlB B-repeat-containing protein [Eubacteriales bacterium]